MRNILPVVHAEHPATLSLERRGASLRLVAGGDWIVPEVPRLDRELSHMNFSGARDASIERRGNSEARQRRRLAASAHQARDGAMRARASSEFLLPEQYHPLLETMDRAKARGAHPWAAQARATSRNIWSASGGRPSMCCSRVTGFWDFWARSRSRISKPSPRRAANCRFPRSSIRSRKRD